MTRGGYRIVEGVSHMTWFGPLQPIEPAVRPEMAEILGALGRQFDYPVGYNLRIVPRQEEPISFDQLRNLREGLDVLKLVLETRKDEYAALEWRFIAREGYTASDAEIKETTEFWQKPDRQNNWDEWLRALLDDRFVLDAASIYPRPTKKGEIQKSAKGATWSFELLDGATIKPLIDGRGRLPQPPSIAYQQIIKGMPAVEYTTEELVYRPRNVRTNHVYGFPEVEQIAMTVNIALRRELHKLQFYTEGNTPEALIGVPKEWSVEQIAAYQLYWDSILAGNTAQRRHSKFVPGGSTYIPTKDASVALKGDFDEWLVRVICYAFSVSPQPFVKMMNRATAQTQQEAAKQQGMVPGMKWIKNLINSLTWVYLQRPNIEFSWQEEEETDPQAQAEVMKTYIDAKIQSPRQCAAILGLDYKPEEFVEPAHITETIQGGDPNSTAEAQSMQSKAQSQAEAVSREGAKPAKEKPEETPPKPAEKLFKIDDKELTLADILEFIKGNAPNVAGWVKRLSSPAKLVKVRSAKGGKSAEKYREIKPVPFDRPSTAKAQKAFANRLASLLKRQRKSFLDQVTGALGKSDAGSSSFSASSASPRWNSPLSKADVEDRVRKLIARIKLEGWALIPDELAPYLEQIFAETGSQILDRLDIATEDSAAAVNDAALEYARERSAEMIGKRWEDGELVDSPNALYSIEETTRDRINSIITNAFTEGEGGTWKDVAAQIEALTNDSDVFSAARAETIARTELGNAHMAGAAAGYEEGRKLGLQYEKKWIADPDCEDECGENADFGWIDYDDTFPSGDAMPLAHPRCRCDLAVRVVEDGDRETAEGE